MTALISGSSCNAIADAFMKIPINPNFTPCFFKKASLCLFLISMAPVISISLNVVNNAYSFCESFNRCAMRCLIFDMGTLVSPPSPPVRFGADDGALFVFFSSTFFVSFFSSFFVSSFGAAATSSSSPPSPSYTFTPSGADSHSSISKMTSPTETSSPTSMDNDLMTPDFAIGISINVLSVDSFMMIASFGTNMSTSINNSSTSPDVIESANDGSGISVA
mmetsp:Transcript_1965/g.2820  ORF Transcript_1965/g.2820 Transcript_1965/m.2820 type:complete len:220 (-) Transcript_1965:223-882(-)